MLATIQSGSRVRRGEELQRRSNKVAAGLRALGLGPGKVIALMLRNDIAFIELMLGAERAGVTAVPLNWHGSLDELRHIVRDSGAAALFAHADFIDKASQIFDHANTTIGIDVPPEVSTAYSIDAPDCRVPTGILNYEDWIAQAEDDVIDPQPPQFRLLYTSGSPGKAKGVMRRRGADGIAEQLAQMARQAHGLEVRPIRAVMTGPLYHSAPGSYALNCARFGELLILQPKFDAAELLELISRHRISHLHAVPTMFSRLLALPPEQRDFADVSSLRAVAHGSAMCPREVKLAIIKWWGPVLYEYYAATETGIITAINSEEWLRHPGSVGRPPKGVEIRIVGEDGSLQGPGQHGDIQLRSDVIPLVEYKDLPDATHEFRLADGWAALGDIGYIDETGYLWLSDRKKDLVITGGVNIFPAEVEQCLIKHPMVRDVIAFGVPDEELGEVVCATVELRETSATSEQELRAWVRGDLGGLRTPRNIQFIERLPREDTGKLARRKARDAFLAMSREKAHG